MHTFKIIWKRFVYCIHKKYTWKYDEDETVQLAYLDVELNYLRFHFYLFQVFIA